MFIALFICLRAFSIGCIYFNIRNDRCLRCSDLMRYSTIKHIHADIKIYGPSHYFASSNQFVMNRGQISKCQIEWQSCRCMYVIYQLYLLLITFLPKYFTQVSKMRSKQSIAFNLRTHINSLNIYCLKLLPHIKPNIFFTLIEWEVKIITYLNVMCNSCISIFFAPRSQDVRGYRSYESQ